MIWAIVFCCLIALFLTCGEDDIEKPTFTVSGSVLLEGTGEGLSDIDVVIEPAVSGGTTTSPSGKYTFSGLRQAETYTITFNSGGTNSRYSQQRREVKEISRNIENFNVTLSPTKGDIMGVIKNALNNEPLAGVRVTISPGNESVITSTDGIYVFDGLSEIEYTLQFIKAGFESDAKKQTVVAGEVQNGDVSLNPIAPIRVEPSQLNFGTSLSSQTFRIVNETSEILSFEVQSADSWLEIERDRGIISGLNSDLIGVSVNRAAVGQGNYTGEIVINVPGRGTRSIEVTMVKLSSEAAVLRLLTEATLNFGSTISERTIALENEGDNTLNWSLSVSETWIKTTINEGSLAPGSDQQFSVIIDRTGLAENVYTGSIDFTSNGGSATVTVVMEVRDQNGGSDELVVTSGLRAYYNFENGRIEDVRGNFQPTAVGVNLVADSPVTSGSSLSFRGSDEYLQLSGNPLRNTNLAEVHGSICFWLKSTTGGTIFAIPYQDNNGENDFLIALKSDRIVHSIRNTAERGGTRTEGAFNLNMGALVLDEEWHMLALVYDGATDLVTLYYDGNRFDGDGIEFDTDGNLGSEVGRIGKDYSGSNVELTSAKDFQGLLDNIRFYSRPLSSSEVKEIFDARQ